MKSSESLLGISVAALGGVVRAFVFALLLLLAAPAAAGAATVSVAPYVEPPLPPGDDGFGSCGRYAQCPADMLVFSAAAGEANQVTITLEAAAGFRQLRIVVREEGFPPVFPPVQAGPGCERLDDRTAACVAGAIGPVYLGDGDDRIDSPSGDVHGGEGADILSVRFSRSVKGDDGDDVLVGSQGDGGPGADLLAVTSGVGGAGDDILRCSPPNMWCHLDGGLGDDVLTGGTGLDRLLGRRETTSCRAARTSTPSRAAWATIASSAARAGTTSTATRAPTGWCPARTDPPVRLACWTASTAAQAAATGPSWTGLTTSSAASA